MNTLDVAEKERCREMGLEDIAQLTRLGQLRETLEARQKGHDLPEFNLAPFYEETEASEFGLTSAMEDIRKTYKNPGKPQKQEDYSPILTKLVQLEGLRNAVENNGPITTYNLKLIDPDNEKTRNIEQAISCIMQDYVERLIAREEMAEENFGDLFADDPDIDQAAFEAAANSGKRFGDWKERAMTRLTTWYENARLYFAGKDESDTC